MSVFPTVRVDDLLSNDRGISVGVMYPGKDTADGVPLIRAGDIKLGIIDPNVSFRIAPEVHDEYRRTALVGGEVLITLVGNPGVAAIVPPEMRGWNAARAVAVVRLKHQSDAMFFKLALSAPHVQEMISNVCNTTVQATLNLKEIRALELPWPEEKMRSKVASILGALDDKIDLNRRMSATLEDMARSLYRSWFVDFDPVHAKREGRQPAFMDEATAAIFPDRFGDNGLPEGWEMSSIYQVARVQYGAPFKSSAFNTEKSGRPLVRIRDLKSHQAGVYTTEVHSKEYLIQPGDTVVGMDGDFTPYTWCAEPSLMNQRICCFMALNERDHAFVRLAIPSLLKAEENAAVATTVIHLGKKDIDTFTVAVPPPSILHAFSQRANPLLSMMVAAGIEAKTLAALRDSLLPKLMSGEIRVGEAREHIEEVA